MLVFWQRKTKTHSWHGPPLCGRWFLGPSRPAMDSLAVATTALSFRGACLCNEAAGGASAFSPNLLRFACWWITGRRLECSEHRPAGQNFFFQPPAHWCVGRRRGGRRLWSLPILRWDPLLSATSYQAGRGRLRIVRPPGTLGHADYFAAWLVAVFFRGTGPAAMGSRDLGASICAGALR